MLKSDQILPYAQSVGIARDDGNYCVRVNLVEKPPEGIFSAFPGEVTTRNGNVVRVIYNIVGNIKAATTLSIFSL